MLSFDDRKQEKSGREPLIGWFILIIGRIHVTADLYYHVLVR